MMFDILFRANQSEVTFNKSLNIIDDSNGWKIVNAISKENKEEMG